VSRLDEVLDRIKNIECPTGHVEEWVSNAFKDYGFREDENLTVNRDKSLDKNGLYAYRAHVDSMGNQSLILFAKSGMDDYVAKVVEAYIK
jgi:hypothetical protein